MVIINNYVGLSVNCVLVEESVNILKEFYVAFLLDRATSKPIVVHSKFGGMDIEEGIKA
jgi:succinyl-CoA synthetase beta subunit